MAVSREVTDLANAGASGLIHAQIGKETVKVGDLPLATHKPRDPELVILKQHDSPCYCGRHNSPSRYTPPTLALGLDADGVTSGRVFLADSDRYHSRFNIDATLL